MDNNNHINIISMQSFKDILHKKYENISEEDENRMLSIFNSIAGEDERIDAEEWQRYTNQIDTDKDGVLSEQEKQNFFKEITTNAGYRVGLEVEKFVNLVEEYNKQTAAVISTVFNNICENMALHSKIPSPKKLDLEPVCDTTYVNPTENNKRAQGSSSHGSFTDSWIYNDQYNSATYNQWLSNNGYVYNEKFSENILQRIKKKCDNPSYQHKCSRAVTDTLIGAKGFQGERQIYAYQNASEYASNDSFKELPNNIVKSMDLSELPAGCVIIYDAGYNDNGSHKYGHIGITDGKGNEISYCKQKIVTAHQEDHIRVFVPVVKDETIS